MIQLRMSVTDLERMRFAYSPLTEVAESLYMVHSGWIDPLYRGWFTMTREKLRRADSAVLRAVVPARGYVANVLLGGTADVTTTIEQQLQLVADCPADQLRADLEGVWRGGDLPSAAQRLLTRGGGPRLADALFQYWQLAIEPHWTQLHALLDADVAYRAGRLARGGIEAMMSDLHPDLELADYAIQIVGRRSSEHDLTGTGLLLIPCVFAWPHIIVDPGRSGPPSLTYGPRGIGALWETRATAPAGDDALGTLLGRSRAAILSYLALPRSTTDLARELGQSSAAVSAHLSILRRCGLVTSWRSGRCVLYPAHAAGEQRCRGQLRRGRHRPGRPGEPRDGPRRWSSRSFPAVTVRRVCAVGEGPGADDPPARPMPAAAPSPATARLYRRLLERRSGSRPAGWQAVAGGGRNSPGAGTAFRAAGRELGQNTLSQQRVLTNLRQFGQPPRAAPLSGQAPAGRRHVRNPGRQHTRARDAAHYLTDALGVGRPATAQPSANNDVTNEEKPSCPSTPPTRSQPARGMGSGLSQGGLRHRWSRVHRCFCALSAAPVRSGPSRRPSKEKEQ